MTRKFKDSTKRKMYLHLLANKPVHPYGRTQRRVGGALFSAYWKGYDGIKPSSLVKESIAYAAWYAGNDTKKEEEKRMTAKEVTTKKIIADLKPNSYQDSHEIWKSVRRELMLMTQNGLKILHEVLLRKWEVEDKEKT